MTLVNRTKNWSYFFLFLVLFQIVFVSYVHQVDASKRKKMMKRLGTLLMLMRMIKKPSIGIMPVPIPMK